MAGRSAVCRRARGRIGRSARLRSSQRRVGDEYDALDIERILELVSNPVFFVLEFNDFEFGKKVLERILDTDGLAVDNDHGEILAGRDFAERMRRNRNWDWRKTSL